MRKNQKHSEGGKPSKDAPKTEIYQFAFMADRAWNELKWSGSPWKKNKEEIM